MPSPEDTSSPIFQELTQEFVRWDEGEGALELNQSLSDTEGMNTSEERESPMMESPIMDSPIMDSPIMDSPIMETQPSSTTPLKNNRNVEEDDGSFDILRQDTDNGTTAYGEVFEAGQANKTASSSHMRILPRKTKRQSHGNAAKSSSRLVRSNTAPSSHPSSFVRTRKRARSAGGSLYREGKLLESMFQTPDHNVTKKSGFEELLRELECRSGRKTPLGRLDINATTQETPTEGKWMKLPKEREYPTKAAENMSRDESCSPESVFLSRNNSDQIVPQREGPKSPSDSETMIVAKSPSTMEETGHGGVKYEGGTMRMKNTQQKVQDIPKKETDDDSFGDTLTFNPEDLAAIDRMEQSRSFENIPSAKKNSKGALTGTPFASDCIQRKNIQSTNEQPTSMITSMNSRSHTPLQKAQSEWPQTHIASEPTIIQNSVATKDKNHNVPQEGNNKIPETQNNSSCRDLFDDFPIDFEVLDRQTNEHERAKQVTRNFNADVVQVNHAISCAQNHSSHQNSKNLRTEQKRSTQVEPQSAISSTDDDLFGELPNSFDFDAVDKLVAERLSGGSQVDNDESPQTIKVQSSNFGEKSSQPNSSFLTFTRYVVVDVREDVSTYTKTLTIKPWTNDFKSRQNKMDANIKKGQSGTSGSGLGCLLLRGEWYHTRCDPDDIIHLCSIRGQQRTDEHALPIILDTNPVSMGGPADDLVLVLHPDMLITPTTVSETVGCSRRAVIRSRMGSSGLTSKAALIGTMRHALFEACMSNNDFSTSFASGCTSHILRQHAESMIGCGLSNTAEATSAVMATLPQIQRFAERFIQFGISDATGYRRRPGGKLEGYGAQKEVQWSARSIHATEESIISPELGLKGNADVTVEATIFQLPASSHSEHDDSLVKKAALTCIELKTGHNQNPQNAHIAQLALYILMLIVRHGVSDDDSNICLEGRMKTNDHTPLSIEASTGGVLLYLNEKGQRAVHVLPCLGEIKSLIGQRNVCAYEMRRSTLPRGVASIKFDVTKSEDDEAAAEFVNVHTAPPAELPQVLATPFSCSKCYTNRECMLYAAAEEAEVVKSGRFSSGVQKSHKNLLRHFTEHLNEEHFKYFHEWDLLIDLEAEHARRLVAESWLQSSSEREQSTGKCISSLILCSGEWTPENTSTSCKAFSPASSTCTLTFTRAPWVTGFKPDCTSQIEVGTRVVVSTDATTLDLSRPRHRNSSNEKPNRFHHRMHVLRGVVDGHGKQRLIIRASKNEVDHVQKLALKFRDTEQNDLPSSELCFRVDKDETYTGEGILRQNLINFLTKDVPAFTENTNYLSQSGDQTFQLCLKKRLPRLRELVIQCHKPSFVPVKCPFTHPAGLSSQHSVPGCSLETLAKEYTELNPDQKNAVTKTLNAVDYVLIQGLPGTGKSSTIAFAARLLAARGKRVLITSYTHAAVDNLMIKLMEKGLHRTNRDVPHMVRIGQESSCHPSVRGILASAIALEHEHKSGPQRRGSSMETPADPKVESLWHVISSARIVGVSALSIPRSSLLVSQHFDVVIVDEAGQISQPAILGALVAADSFILVGDHMQLPPLVSSEVAERAGYGVSMMKRLAERRPESIAQLTIQYRMHEGICRLCNEIVYNGKLKCADDRVRLNLIELPGFPSSLSSSVHRTGVGYGWLAHVIDPKRPVVFVDTDQILGRNDSTNPARTLQGKHKTAAGRLPVQEHERKEGTIPGGKIVNPTEVALVHRIVQGLIQCGAKTTSIGIISPYRAQLRMFEKNDYLAEAKSQGLEISTIDRYQGRDKEAIVLSFVRSNHKGKTGRLLEDFRRLNVAVSRAKRKLILVGSFTTLTSGSEVLRPLLQNMKDRGEVELVPTDPFVMHPSR